MTNQTNKAVNSKERVMHIDYWFLVKLKMKRSNDRDDSESSAVGGGVEQSKYELWEEKKAYIQQVD